MNNQLSAQEAYNELAYYTLAHPDSSFIHQLIVDAYAAQNATSETQKKPIGLAFALVGLYLHIEKNYSGKEVQLAHMDLARERKPWPTFTLPKERGAVTVFNVLAEPEGPARDKAIEDWCLSVWQAYKESHAKVRQLVQTELLDRQ